MTFRQEPPFCLDHDLFSWMQATGKKSLLRVLKTLKQIKRNDMFVYFSGWRGGEGLSVELHTTPTFHLQSKNLAPCPALWLETIRDKNRSGSKQIRKF